MKGITRNSSKSAADHYQSVIPVERLAVYYIVDGNTRHVKLTHDTPVVRGGVPVARSRR